MRTLEQAFSVNPTMPLMAALAFHGMLFVLNPTVLQRGVSSLGDLAPMVIKTADKLPDLAPPVPKLIPKPAPKPKEKPVAKKKAGLAPKAQPKPKPVFEKPKPAHHTFVSKIELPKFIPHDDDALMASSAKPDLAPAARQRMVQSAVPAPSLLHGKSHGITVDDIHMQLVDRSSLSSAGARTVPIPVGDERGDVPVLPAAVLHNAATGVTRAGYRYTPGEGSAELAGRDKAGYHGVIKSDHYEEGSLSASSSSKTIRGNGFEISGSVGDRKILSRQVPEYPRWAEEKGVNASVQVYFTVRADGSIRSTLRIQRSSGYAELDQLAKEALLKWKFSPSSDGDDSVSWGVITFRFTLA